MFVSSRLCLLGSFFSALSSLALSSRLGLLWLGLLCLCLLWLCLLWLCLLGSVFSGCFLLGSVFSASVFSVSVRSSLGSFRFSDSLYCFVGGVVLLYRDCDSFMLLLLCCYIVIVIDLLYCFVLLFVKVETNPFMYYDMQLSGLQLDLASFDLFLSETYPGLLSGVVVGVLCVCVFVFRVVGFCCCFVCGE